HNNTASSYEDAALGEYVVGRPGLIAEVTNDHGLIVGRIVAASPEGALIRADRMESDVPGYNSTADGLVGAPWHHILRRAQPPETSSHEVVTQSWPRRLRSVVFGSSRWTRSQPRLLRSRLSDDSALHSGTRPRG
ncbi:MAG: hypothetical protein AAFQ17_05650, partial [Pseudomonadota bacterium]